MRKLSNSTKLMNLFIGFSFPNCEYDAVFHKEGYQLEWIEPHFNDSKGQTINPDLQFKSHEEKNLVFIECKLGSFEHDQALRYQGLSPSDIVSSYITSLDMTLGTFEIVYCCDEVTKDKLITGEEKNQYGFSVICCNDSSISIEKDKFKSKKFKNILLNAKIPDKIPTSFYPFGPDDKKSYIAQHVYQSLLRLSGEGKKEITIEDVLRDSHIYYDTIHTNCKNKLKFVVGAILKDLEQNDFSDVIKRMNAPFRYKILSNSFRKFRDLCLKKMDEYEKEAPQKTLFESVVTRTNQ